MIHQYSVAARRRIRSAVQWVETQSLQKNTDAKQYIPQPVNKLMITSEDIEHGGTGSAKLLQGNAIWSALTAWDEQEFSEVYNPGQKVWAGCRIVVSRVSVAQAAAEYRQAWYIANAWSATRVRGKTTQQIPAGGTGVVTVAQAIDGELPAQTITAYLPTEFVSVAADRVVWAELVYRVGGSRWEIYSADCDGA